MKKLIGEKIKMLKTLGAVYIYIYIVRFNKIKLCKHRENYAFQESLKGIVFYCYRTSNIKRIKMDKKEILKK